MTQDETSHVTIPDVQAATADAVRSRQQHFMTLLGPVHARLSRYCYALTGDFDEGRDLLSDAILLAYESIENLRATEAFTTYIFTTARRLHYRRSSRKKWWGIFSSDLENKPEEGRTSPEVSHDIQILDKALKTLPEQQREAVILFEITGFSMEEISKIQGSSISAVKARVSRGRKQLAKQLGEPQDAPPKTAQPAPPTTIPQAVRAPQRHSDDPSGTFTYSITKAL
jgi:RNA polymerase sigma-70 factor (ECF subfamily)